MSERGREVKSADSGEARQAPEPVSEAVAAAREAVLLLEQAERLARRFRRLFWVAMGGVGLTLAAVIGGDWEAHPGWYLGWAAVGQGWLIGMAWWAFRVYGRGEAAERAARDAAARAAGGSPPAPEEVGPV